jgi:phosphomannomutase/phosphoglucomutase
VVRIDGLRVECPDGFGVARASNTMPLIVLRFDAEVATAFARIQDELRRLPGAAKPGVAMPC